MPGRGFWDTTRPRSERLERTRRTLPTEQFARRIFVFAAREAQPEDARDAAAESEAVAVAAEVVAAVVAAAAAAAVAAEVAVAVAEEVAEAAEAAAEVVAAEVAEVAEAVAEVAAHYAGRELEARRSSSATRPDRSSARYSLVNQNVQSSVGSIASIE